MYLDSVSPIIRLRIKLRRTSRSLIKTIQCLETSKQTLGYFDLVPLLIADFAHKGKVDTQLLGDNVGVLAGKAAILQLFSDQILKLGIVHEILL
jgi:hypothetical protein